MINLDKLVHKIISERGALVSSLESTRKYEFKDKKTGIQIIQITRPEKRAYNNVYSNGTWVYSGRTKDGLEFERELFVGGDWVSLIEKIDQYPRQLKIDF